MKRGLGNTLTALVVTLATLVGTVDQAHGQSSNISTTSLSQGLTPADLVSTLVGGNSLSVSNVTYAGHPLAAGRFTAPANIIGFPSGIVLCSGAISSTAGPNTADNTTTSFTTAGDSSLEQAIGVPPGTTFDGAVLEFDFIPTATPLTFSYVFGSEEYNEFVNSQFNDTFGFFLNGSNVAIIPGTNVPVAINNVNGGNPLGTNASRSQYYRNNALPNASINTQLDGLTVVFQVNAPVTLNVVNHIKLAIADTSDRILDSCVFMQQGSFNANLPSPGTGGTDVDKSDPKPKKLTEEQKQQKSRTDTSSLDDTRIEGNVLEVRCSRSDDAEFDVQKPKDTPYIVVGNRDGPVQVRLYEDAKNACKSAKAGDYLKGDGEKDNEQLFDASGIKLYRNGDKVK
ncbi:MAG: choice-of-anchor L domain-containing protein [Chloroflexota bacterium]